MLFLHELYFYLSDSVTVWFGIHVGVKRLSRFKGSESCWWSITCTVDREVFAVKIIRVLNFCVKNISPPDGSTSACTCILLLHV